MTYRWLVEETVAATNTLTHAILGFPVVANGLASIITVLFGGALLLGAGGVFGAFLVIVGVVFAAALFASSGGADRPVGARVLRGAAVHRAVADPRALASGAGVGRTR